MTGMTVAPNDRQAFDGTAAPARTSPDTKPCSAGRLLPRDRIVRAGASPDGAAAVEAESGRRAATQVSWFP